jgi:hypothetical protein
VGESRENPHGPGLQMEGMEGINNAQCSFPKS